MNVSLNGRKYISRLINWHIFTVYLKSGEQVQLFGDLWKPSSPNDPLNLTPSAVAATVNVCQISLSFQKRAFAIIFAFLSQIDVNLFRIAGEFLACYDFDFL